MKVQKINESIITSEDIIKYKEAISKLEGYVFNASDVNMDMRTQSTNHKALNGIMCSWLYRLKISMLKKEAMNLRNIWLN